MVVKDSVTKSLKEFAFIFRLLGQKKNKIVLPPEISWVKIFLSPTRPHKSNVSENIYFLFQRNRHTNKKISTCKFICTILRFFYSNNKR